MDLQVRHKKYKFEEWEEIYEDRFLRFKNEKERKIDEKLNEWMNIGGQLIPSREIESLKQKIKSNKIKSWEDIHRFYQQQSENYSKNKRNHAYSIFLKTNGISHKQFTPELLSSMLKQLLVTKQWMTEKIYDSREKDYSNPFREMVYNNKKEMESVVGKLEDNSFIKEQKEAFEKTKKEVTLLIKKWKL